MCTCTYSTWAGVCPYLDVHVHVCQCMYMYVYGYICPWVFLVYIRDVLIESGKYSTRESLGSFLLTPQDCTIVVTYLVDRVFEIQWIPLYWSMSVRGCFGPIKRRTRLSKEWLIHHHSFSFGKVDQLHVRGWPVKPVAPLSGIQCIWNK